MPVSEDDAARLDNPPPLGYSLSNVLELLLGCLEAVRARSVLEIGTYEGDLTVEVLAWAEASGAEVATVDPAPPPKLRERSRAHPELVVHEATSHKVLAGLEALPDAVIIDGDHNYFTLSEELRLTAELAGEDPLPLLMFHDVSWPHARRDTYYDADRIPEDKRPPVGKEVGLVPGDPGVIRRASPIPGRRCGRVGPETARLRRSRTSWNPARASASRSCRPSSASACCGRMRSREPSASRSCSGRSTDTRCSSASRAIAVEHLVAGYARGVRIAGLEERVDRYEQLLREMLESRAFTVAEHVSRAYQRGKPTFSRERLRRALER